MSTVVACPQCGKSLKVRDELVGKKLKCPCGSIVSTPAPAVPAAAPAPVQASTPPPVPQDRYPRWETIFLGTKNMLVFDDDSAWHANLTDEEHERVTHRLENGAAQKDALEGVADRTQVRFDRITNVLYEEQDRRLDVTYDLSDGSATVGWNMEDVAQRDAVFEALRGRLGPRFRYERRRLGRIEAGLMPLIALCIVALATAALVGLAWGLNQLPGGAVVTRGPIWAFVLMIAAYTIGCMGPSGNGVLGGVVMLACVAWIAVRVANPPVQITLTAEKEDQKPRRGKDIRGSDDKEE